MTRFATIHPRRVVRLIYHDAVMDGAEMLALMARARVPYPPYPNEAERLINISQSHLDFRKIDAPALAFIVLFDRAYAEQADAVLRPRCGRGLADNVKRY
jgi:hypothetical protein